MVCLKGQFKTMHLRIEFSVEVEKDPCKPDILKLIRVDIMTYTFAMNVQAKNNRAQRKVLYFTILLYFRFSVKQNTINGNCVS